MNAFLLSFITAPVLSKREKGCHIDRVYEIKVYVVCITPKFAGLFIKSSVAMNDFEVTLTAIFQKEGSDFRWAIQVIATKNCGSLMHVQVNQLNGLCTKTQSSLN